MMHNPIMHTQSYLLCTATLLVTAVSAWHLIHVLSHLSLVQHVFETLT